LLEFECFCLDAVSGTTPKDPVVSKKSGHVFERSLIEKIVKDIGRCPVTDEPLELEDLIDVKSSTVAKARPTTATSVPALLSLLQNEWDATVLETYQLRKTLQTTRQELSHALYQHDAATRVIARLINERNTYREKFEQAQAVAKVTAPSEKPEANGSRRLEQEEGVEPSAKKAKGGLDSAVVNAMTATSKELSKYRKKRTISSTVASVEDISGYGSVGSFPVHATRKGGILAVSICPDAQSSLVASAGSDATVHLFDIEEKSSLHVLKGHTKKVLDVCFVKNKSALLSSGSDGTVRLWKESGEGYDCAAVLEDSGTASKRKDEVVSINVHPSGGYFFTACADGAWSLYDVEQTERLVRVGPKEGESFSYTAAALHPDGLILCTGTNNATMKVWETRTQQSVATLEGHVGSISSISFSENGYSMVSAAKDGVKIWDLRKLASTRSLEPFGSEIGVSSVQFDASGLFLAVGGPHVGVYAVKQDWSMVKEFTDVPKKGVNAVAWGQDARSLVVGAADHNLRFFG